MILLLVFSVIVNGQQYVIDSLQKQRQVTSEKNQAHLLNKICFENILVGNLEEAHIIAIQAKEKAIETKNLDEEAIAYKHTGIIYNFLNKTSEAQSDYKKAIDILNQTKNYEQLIKVIHNLANLYLKQGNFAMVYENLSIAESIAKEHHIISVPLLGSQILN